MAGCVWGMVGMVTISPHHEARRSTCGASRPKECGCRSATSTPSLNKSRRPLLPAPRQGQRPQFRGVRLGGTRWVAARPLRHTGRGRGGTTRRRAPQRGWHALYGRCCSPAASGPGDAVPRGVCHVRHRAPGGRYPTRISGCPEPLTVGSSADLMLVDIDETTPRCGESCVRGGMDRLDDDSLPSPARPSARRSCHTLSRYVS